MHHLIEIQDRDTIPYSCDWSQEIFLEHVQIDRSTHYQDFYTVQFACQTPTLMPACQAVWTIFMIVYGMTQNERSTNNQ